MSYRNYIVSYSNYIVSYSKYIVSYSNYIVSYSNYTVPYSNYIGSYINYIVSYSNYIVSNYWFLPRVTRWSDTHLLATDGRNVLRSASMSTLLGPNALLILLSHSQRIVPVLWQCNKHYFKTNRPRKKIETAKMFYIKF